MAKVKGVTDLGIFPVLGQPNLNIKVDRDKAARYGLNAGDINTVVQAALGGTVATTLLEADRQFNVTVRLAPEYRDNIDSVRNIKVGYQTPAGVNAYIPLSELADISLDTGASYIYHERNERYIPIKFSVRGRDLGSTVAEAQQRIAQNVKLPTGYRIVWAGEFEELQQAKARLAIIVPISLVMILVLLYGLFNSLRDSLLALARYSVRGWRRRAGALSCRLGFQHFGGGWVCLAVRRIGDERHSHHDLLQRGQGNGYQHGRGHVPRRIAAHAADADDGAVRLHRPAAGSDLNRHRQPGAAPARDRGGWRHVHWTNHLARHRAGTANAVFGSGTGFSGISGPTMKWPLMSAWGRFC